MSKRKYFINICSTSTSLFLGGALSSRKLVKLLINVTLIGELFKSDKSTYLGNVLDT